MVVEEDCLAPYDGQTARTHAATSRKKGACVSQDADFAINARRRDYEPQQIHLANPPLIWWIAMSRRSVIPVSTVPF
jgi:hypothetical protein